MVDETIQGITRRRWRYCAFYTEAEPIRRYMIRQLQAGPTDRVLEPCAGDGAFVADLACGASPPASITALEVNSEAAEGLRRRFHGDSRVLVRQADALLDDKLDQLSTDGGKLTRVIANPPWGAWQDPSRRVELKRRYGGYVKESYTLFLRRCLDLLAEDGRLVFIVPDTFLALHRHAGLRRHLLETASVEEIVLIPSNAFGANSFGYSGIALLTATKTAPDWNHATTIASGTSHAALEALARGDYTQCRHRETVLQREVLGALDHSFLLHGNSASRRLVNTAELRLGDLADCVTGFYSGANRVWLGVVDSSVRGAKGYRVVPRREIATGPLPGGALDGLSDGRRYVPILKGRSAPLRARTEWVAQWDPAAVAHYRRDHKARLQNTRFYFRDGIGLPMVRSGRLKAFLLEGRLFDQSVVGIFPKDPDLTSFLLGFLNSTTATRLLDQLNHTANNSANYVKKLPIALDEAAVARVSEIIARRPHAGSLERTLSELDAVFAELYGTTAVREAA